MRLVRLLLVAALAVLPRAASAQGEPLGPEFRVNTYTTGYQFDPAVASDASGNFVVVWMSYPQDGESQDVFGQRFANSGTPLGPEFRVSTTPFPEDPAVASDSSGNFVVVWTSYHHDGSDRGVFGQRYDSTGAPLGPEFRVNTYTTDDQLFPAVASDSSGNFVVVWESYQDGSSTGVFCQRYASSGAPLGPEFRVNTYTPSFQNSPDVASDASGNFVVVWQSEDQDGSDSGVFGQVFASSGEPLGPEFRVNTHTPHAQGSPSIAALSAGKFVIVWTGGSGQDGDSFGVFGKRCCSSTGTFGSGFRVNAYTTDSQSTADVASDASGNFVVVWQSDDQDGSSNGIFGQRYASSGAPLGPEFRVNTHTINHQTVAAVASDASGNFVVVWRSSGQDGSDSGIFGQRYSQIVPVELMHFRVE